MSAQTSSAPGNRKLLVPVLAAIVLMAGGIVRAADQGRSFLVDYSARVNLFSVAGYDEVILDPFATETLPSDGEGDGPAFYAYLSVVEVPAGASYEKKAQQGGLLLEGLTNEVWGSKFAAIEKPEWSSFVVDTLAGAAVEKGFDGFFLDTADSIRRLPGADQPARLTAYRDSLVALIRTLHERYPDKPIILNRGFEVIDALPKGALSGVLIESVFQTYDHASKTYGPVPSTDTKQLIARIADLRKRGLSVSVIDYVDPENAKLAAATARKIEALGAAALVTTPDLQGLVLAPAVPVARRILVLYGYDLELVANHGIWPSDTEVARQLQPALEWMGYELRFHRVTDAKLPQISSADYAGIIVESGVTLRSSEEHRYVDWLLERRKEGFKILFTGSYPFQDGAARSKLMGGLGIKGVGETVVGAREVKIARKDEELFDYEREVKPLPLGFIETGAPEGATPHLRLECKDQHGRTRRFDSAFTADWGGVLLHPYWNFQPSLNDSFSFVDPFAFLDRIFPGNQFPAPDATTRNGLRLLWSHIDGDGFVTLSNIQRGTICAEIIRDEILKKYPFPTTVSVIEAEIRALQLTQDPKSWEANTAIAREIFRMPHIEAASHAYSHPFVWSKNDVAPHDNYEYHCLRLRPEHASDEVEVRREVVGSIQYIERELLPADKKVEIMLWSGNCRPFQEALRYTRELGIENMNGGFTVYSKRHQQIAAVAPRVTWWEDQLQIYAANQNDYVYTNDWSGPTYGGFEQVIDSFERLDGPRRLKPVNIYYHFYSAANQGALTALDRIHQWAVAQPLHVVTASEAASLTRGAVHAQLRKTGKNRWLVTDHGTLTTFRIPKSLGYPDLAECTNVIGFNDHGTERYIHTNGESFAEIVLAPEPPHHLYLKSSEAVVSFRTLAPAYCEFTSKSWRSPQLVFGGAAAGSSWTLTYKEADRTTVTKNLTAGADGFLVFKLPAQTSASLTPASFTSIR